MSKTKEEILKDNFGKRFEELFEYKNDEWLKAAMEEYAKQEAAPIIKALKEFISMHETGLLPNRFTYIDGKKALDEYLKSKQP